MEAFRTIHPDLDDVTELDAFEASLRGSLIMPGNPDYDTARQVKSASFDRHPALIVRAADASDVARTVLFAQQAGLALSVRGGGHSLAGYGTNDGGIVLDLGAMKGLHIDPDRRMAWAQPGLTAGEYTVAAAAHGLATPFGDTASVGIARPDARRRDRLAGPQVRPGHRRARGGRDRHRRWADRHGQRDVAPRPVLGGPRRWRQLRGRHPLPVQALSGRRDPRRCAVHAGHPRRPAQPRADRRERARGAHDHLLRDAPAARPVRPGRAGRHAVGGHHVRVERRSRGRPGRPPAVPRGRDAAHRHGHADALSRASTRCWPRPRSGSSASIARASCRRSTTRRSTPSSTRWPRRAHRGR